MGEKNAAAHEICTLPPCSQQPLAVLRYRKFTVAFLIVTLASFLGSKVVKNRKNGGAIVDSKSNNMQGIQVNYAEVPSGRDDVKLYTATKNVEGGGAAPLTTRAWMALVSSDSTDGINAASDLSDIIASSSYPSVLFETPGVSWISSDEVQFRFAIVNAPALQAAERNPDRYAFEEHFEACDKNDSVCSFVNLGGDALLVSPVPQTNVGGSAYSHLASFVRNAPKQQVHEFWRLSARRHTERLKQKQNDEKMWFSTNGMGVYWLHLRLDDWPKYYSYEPFTR